MYIVTFFIGFLFWKSCKFWRRLRALDYIWKSGVGFTLFYLTNLFVEILGRKGSGTMIFIVSWCYGGLAMVIFILFWQGSYPPWWHHTGIMTFSKVKAIEDVKEVMIKTPKGYAKNSLAEKKWCVCVFFCGRDFVGPKIDPNCKAHVHSRWIYIFWASEHVRQKLMLILSGFLESHMIYV